MSNKAGYIRELFRLLTAVPRSQNVSLGSDVVFSCGTNDSSLDIILFFSSNIAASVLNEQLVEGGSVSKVLVKAVVSEYNESSFTCYLLNGTNLKYCYMSKFYY